MVAGRSSATSLLYRGEPLDDCDISSIDFIADLSTWSIEGTVAMACYPGSFEDESITPDPAKGMWRADANFRVAQLYAKQTDFTAMTQGNESLTASIAEDL